MHPALQGSRTNKIAALMWPLTGIGDHYFALPALRALLSISSNDLMVIGSPEIARHTFQPTEFRNVRELETRNQEPDWQLDETLLNEYLRDRDILVSICGSTPPQLERIVKNEKSIVTIGLTDCFKINARPLKRLHAFDLYFELARVFDSSLDIETFSNGPELCSEGKLLREQTSGAERAGEQLVVIHTETKPTKCWSSEKWAHLCRMIRKAYPRMSIICIDMDAPTGALGEIFGSDPKCLHAPLTPFSMTAGLIAGASAFIGVDSYALHVADLFRIPAVGVFRCTDPRDVGLRFKYSTSNIEIPETGEGVEAVFALFEKNLIMNEKGTYV